MNETPVSPVMDAEREASLRTVGHISYVLHLLVALGAVLPGAQGSVALLAVAFVIDIVKRGDAPAPGRKATFHGASAACCGRPGCTW